MAIAMTRVGVIGALILALFAVPARAEPPLDRARAQELLRQGAAAMEAGEYQDALAHFIEAQKLVSSPKIQYNLGNAYSALARPALAYQAFDRFVREATDAQPTFLKRARQRLVELRAEIAQLLVVSSEPGAEVIVDGKTAGRTPIDEPIIVDPGSHSVVAKWQERTLSEALNLAGGETRALNFAFKAEPDRLGLERPSPPEVSRVDLTERPEPQHLTPAPFYKRTWFWVGVGVVAVGAGTAVALATRGKSYPSADARATWPVTAGPGGP